MRFPDILGEIKSKRDVAMINETLRPPTIDVGRGAVGGGRNGAVDVLRLLMAMFVMLNHSCVFGQYVHGVLEMAVPVFLMLSGYFFFTQDASAERRQCARQLRKIGKLTFFSYAFYILWHLVWRSCHSMPLMFDWSTLYSGVNGFAPHLWYLHAYLLMLAFVYGLHRFGCCLGSVRCRWLLLYAAVSFLLYHVDDIPSLIVNVFFYCLGFFSLGMAMRRWRVKVRPRIILALLALSLCGCIVNPLLKIDMEGYPLFVVLASALAVETAASRHVASSHVLARMGRNCPFIYTSCIGQCWMC